LIKSPKKKPVLKGTGFFVWKFQNQTVIAGLDPAIQKARSARRLSSQEFLAQRDAACGGYWMPRVALRMAQGVRVSKRSTGPFRLLAQTAPHPGHDEFGGRVRAVLIAVARGAASGSRLSPG